MHDQSGSRRRIAVMRHAKAEQSGPTDFERALAQRGHADAAAAGAWLASTGFRPDLALVSAAVRTQETWESVARAAGWDAEVDLSEALYAAGPETALDLLRETEDHVRGLLVVGHNPTMSYLASLLDDGEGDDGAGNEMAIGYPTSAVALFEFDGPWAGLDEAGATLVGFHVGRGE